MQAAADEKPARPESHPKRLLFGAALPPEDSTMERLGSRRQSSAYLSEASRNTRERSATGQWPRLKNERREARRGSFAGSLRCSAAGFWEAEWLPDTGMATTPAKTAKPFESSLRISRLPRF